MISSGVGTAIVLPNNLMAGSLVSDIWFMERPIRDESPRFQIRGQVRLVQSALSLWGLRSLSGKVWSDDDECGAVSFAFHFDFPSCCICCAES